MRTPAIQTILLLAAITASASGQDRTSHTAGRGKGDDPFAGANVVVYKRVENVELKMYIFKPAGHTPQSKSPAVVFFFGGGWSGGEPRQFANHCRYLASRGMVAMAADYRVYSRQQAEVKDCLADAKSAIRWVRTHAARLGVDPDRIVAAGGSAGGHLAASVGTLDGFDQAGEDTSVSARPNAMLLFNPALDLTGKDLGGKGGAETKASLHSRLGAKPEELSPLYHVRPGTPPAIIFHGTKDTTVPYTQAVKFQEEMKSAGNRCELASYEGEKHGFFNYGNKGNKPFIATLTRADEFLTSLGYLTGPPKVEEFFQTANRGSD